MSDQLSSELDATDVAPMEGSRTVSKVRFGSVDAIESEGEKADFNERRKPDDLDAEFDYIFTLVSTFIV